MQTDVVSARIAAAAHSGRAVLNTGPSQLIIDDWRLRGWALTASGGAWAAPSSPYRLVGTPQGDYITKSAGVSYRSHVLYRSHIGYRGGTATNIWDLGYQDLGVHTPVSLPDGSTDTPYVSSVAMSGTQDLICWYANKPRNLFDSGIYVQRVVDDGAGHVYWSEPTQVYGSATPDDANQSSQFFITFPRLQVINGEYWILALECSLQNIVITYHLCYFRSADGIHWSDREYLAGVSNDTAEENSGINSYLSSGVPTAFARDDLKHAYLNVSGTSTYIRGKNGNNFVCGSTTLVGITNPAKQLDITLDVKDWTLSLPTAPTSAQGSYTLQNPTVAGAGKYNNSSLIVAGARLIHKAGYVTSSGAELLTLAQELIDEVRQPTKLEGGAQNELRLTTQDYSAWLRDWEGDVFWEWSSPRRATLDLFCDLSALTVMDGSYLVGADSILQAGRIASDSQVPDDVAYIHEARTVDGALELQWRLRLTKTNIYAGVVFQGIDDRNFWALRYNGNLGKYELLQATPIAAGHQNYAYGAAVQTSGAVATTAGTWYWLKVAQWHNHVIAWHSTDRITWTKVIDYTAPLGTLPASAQYWGIVGKSLSTPSGTIGQLAVTGGKQAMDSGGNPLMFALRVQSPAHTSVLRALAVVAGQVSVPPALIISLVRDVGGGAGPAGATNPANVLFTGLAAANSFAAGDAAPSWVGVGVAPYVALAASTYYWITVTFDGTLTGSQKWYWYSEDPAANTYGVNRTRQSANAGATWSSLSNTSMNLAAVLFSDIDGAFAEFNAMYWTSAESAKTIERIANDIAAKAWVLSLTADAFLKTADLALGGDGILWQPVGYGTIGDMVLDADVTISATAGIVLRASSIGGGATNGYRIVLDPGTQLIKVYQPSAVLAEQIDSLQYLPSGSAFHVQIVSSLQFLYVFVNEALAATYYDGALTTPGYIGLVSAGTTWANVRVPDMTEIMPYHVLEAAKNAQTGLDELTQKSRFKWFLRFDGTLRIGSFANLASMDSYSATIEATENTHTGRYEVNQLTPSGNYYATRFNAAGLDRTGKRRYQVQQYTDAQSNEQAYLDGDLVLQRSQEHASTYTLEGTAVLATEREDRVNVVNPLDGVSADYLVTDIELSGSLNPSVSHAKLGVRKAV